MMLAALILTAQAALTQQPATPLAPAPAHAPAALAPPAAHADAVHAPAATAAPGPLFEHVLVISVDGLRPDAIDPDPAGTTPALARMLRGPGTLNARTDPDATVTLPNHVGILTSCMQTHPQGHGWRMNGEPPQADRGGTVHATAERYVPGMFDVAHDRGLSTGVFVGKTKFWLLMQSYGPDAGAPDLVPPDNGKSKIDLFLYGKHADAISTQVIAWLHAQQGRSLAFVHYADPDRQGHTTGWVLEKGSPYLAAVSVADAALGRVLAAIDASPQLRGKVAVILTADHGGGDPLLSHSKVTSACNFRIPFLIWLGQDTPALDLAAINADRRAQPRLDQRIDGADELQPIRNGDAGNLALQLLGLPAIEGSQCNAAQDLRMAPAPVPTP